MGRLLHFLVLILVPAPLVAETLPGPYAAEILEVIDGDTVRARIRVWLGLEQTVLVRLAGIDAPELDGTCPGEPEAARAARDHLAGLLKEAPVRIEDVGRDKYGGRILARLRRADGSDVASLMLHSGHAVPMTGARAKGCGRAQ